MAPPTPNANGDWFYDKQTGQISHITNFFEKMYFEARSDKYVSFNTQADAQAFKVAYEASQKGQGPNPLKEWWFNPEDGTIFHGTPGEMKSPWIAFGSQAEAEAYLKQHPPNFGLGGIGSAVGGALTVPTSIGGFFKALTSKNTWIRIGEGVVGVSLLVIGVAIVAQNSPATKGVAKVAKYIK